MKRQKLGARNALTEVTSLAPAAGMGSIVAPAKYTAGNGSTYVYEKRWVNDECVDTVLIDSRTSQANRLEDYISRALKLAIRFSVRCPKFAYVMR